MKLAKQIAAIMNLLDAPGAWTHGVCAKTATGLHVTLDDNRACQFCLIGAAAKVAAPKAEIADSLNFSPYDWFDQSEVGKLIVACLPPTKRVRDTDSPYIRTYVFNDENCRAEKSYGPDFRLPGTGRDALMAMLEEARLHASAAGI
jgi:hypothetical protein